MDTETIVNYVINTPNNTNPNVLRGMVNEVAGDKLPPIEAGDSGKILTVKEDESGAEWGEAGGAFVTTFTLTPNPWYPSMGEKYNVTADHTSQEIYEANVAGKMCIGVADENIYILSNAHIEENWMGYVYYVTFSSAENTVVKYIFGSGAGETTWAYSEQSSPASIDLTIYIRGNEIQEVALPSMTYWSNIADGTILNFKVAYLDGYTYTTVYYDSIGTGVYSVNDNIGSCKALIIVNSPYDSVGFNLGVYVIDFVLSVNGGSASTTGTTVSKVYPEVNTIVFSMPYVGEYACSHTFFDVVSAIQNGNPVVKIKPTYGSNNYYMATSGVISTVSSSNDTVTFTTAEVNGTAYTATINSSGVVTVTST